MKVQAESKFNVGDWVRIGNIISKVLNVDYRADSKGSYFGYAITTNVHHQETHVGWFPEEDLAKVTVNG